MSPEIHDTRQMCAFQVLLHKPARPGGGVLHVDVLRKLYMVLSQQVQSVCYRYYRLLCSYLYKLITKYCVTNESVHQALIGFITMAH